MENLPPPATPLSPQDALAALRNKYAQNSGFSDQEELTVSAYLNKSQSVRHVLTGENMNVRYSKERSDDNVKGRGVEGKFISNGTPMQQF